MQEPHGIAVRVRVEQGQQRPGVEVLEFEMVGRPLVDWGVTVLELRHEFCVKRSENDQAPSHGGGPSRKTVHDGL